ncbi:MAG TPA: hypothetical protein VGQ58_06985 [Candidatus Limnocylindrales bacterium]|jgi:hypothetical protein|nr:hypothetical protein [Candidatus Limnocylindrales bacterium]
MAGYAAAMRIERIEVRGGLAARPDRAGSAFLEAAEAVAVIELAGREPGEDLRQRLADLRIYFGQLTWYLFNAEGWR